MRDKLISTTKYAAKRELLVLYAVLFVGLSLLNWNVFLPVFGLLGGFGSTIAVALRGIFAFLTAVVGFAITVVAFVGIVKIVVDDAVGEDSVDLTETAEAPVDTDGADEENEDAEPATVDAAEDGQAAE